MQNALSFTGAIQDYVYYPYIVNEDYDGYGYLLTNYTTTGLDLWELMLYIMERTTDSELANDLETVVYENEVIDFRDINNMTLSHITLCNVNDFKPTL